MALIMGGGVKCRLYSAKNGSIGRDNDHCCPWSDNLLSSSSLWI